MLDRLRLLLRLHMLDQKYHEVGGLYDLGRAGQLDPMTVAEVEIERAMTNPPPGGRAALRADLIKAHYREAGWAASWHCVVRPKTGEGFDLSDPFSAERKAKLAVPPALRRSLLELLTR
jgi:hypothetical protein